MTDDQNLEAIRQKCVEANPEIMELKSGCEVLYTTPGGRKIKQLVHIRTLNGGVNALCATLENRHDGFTGAYNYPINRLEVVGRPIRLDDVRKVVKEDYWGELIEIWVDGYLDDQPVRVIDWLSSLGN